MLKLKNLADQKVLLINKVRLMNLVQGDSGARVRRQWKVSISLTDR